MESPGDRIARGIAFKKDQAPGKVGDLDTGSYAFAAVARAEDCGVLATGCVEAGCWCWPEFCDASSRKFKARTSGSDSS